MASRIKWVNLATAPNQLTAELWQGLLSSEGIPAMVHTGNISSYHLGVSNVPCRLMVPEDHLVEARRLLEEHLGPEELV